MYFDRLITSRKIKKVLIKQIACNNRSKPIITKKKRMFFCSQKREVILEVKNQLQSVR
jgi:hypothetical protein